jgi:hypothetical protein
MSNYLFARINNVDYDVDSAKVKFAYDEAGTFSVKILAKEIDWQNLFGNDIELWENGTLIVSGFIDKRPQLTMGKYADVVVDLKCLDEIARFTMYRAKSTAHYQDQQVISILNDLITTAGINWTVTLVNMIDPFIETTVDLRNKESLFAQISETIRSVPDLHMRYGGVDSISGDYILEVGNFGELTEEAVQNFNLFDLKLKYSTNKIYKTCESFGDSTNTNRIDLFDALSDARTIAHPDYAQFPISQDVATGAWICTNTAVSFGYEVRKSFNVIKTKNDVVPTPAEVAEAGYALWLKTVRFLKKSASYEVYSGSLAVKTISQIGDKIRIKSTVLEPIFDSVTGTIIEHHETFSVNDTFRLTDVSYEFSKASLPSLLDNAITEEYHIITFEVTSNDEVEIVDSDLELYERLERFDNYDNSTGSAEFYPVQTTSLTYGNADAADCNAAGGVPPPSDGKNYTMASPAYPGWVTNVTTWYTISENGRIKQLTEPVAPGSSWVACVQDDTGVWPPPIGQDITITVYWFFT